MCYHAARFFAEQVSRFMASPLQTVKSQYGNKAALVDKLLPLLDRASEESEVQFKDRLSRVSNAKLLRLLARVDTVKSKFGSREALVDKIVTTETGGRVDADLRNSLLTQSTGRLIDRMRRTRNRG